MREPTIKDITVFIKIIAVDNQVNKLWVYDFLGAKHELPIPNSPTVHSFIADLMLLRSQGLKGILNNDPELFPLSPPLNKNTLAEEKNSSIEEQP
jgi:hypothetical protein